MTVAGGTSCSQQLTAEPSADATVHASCTYLVCILVPQQCNLSVLHREITLIVSDVSRLMPTGGKGGN